MSNIFRVYYKLFQQKNIENIGNRLYENVTDFFLKRG
jgi:hypothetical protein